MFKIVDAASAFREKSSRVALIEAEREADPDALAVVVADVQGEVVCAG